VISVKIILVHNEYREPGGEDVVFDQECHLLERAGHEVVVYRRSNLELEDVTLAQRLALAARIVSASDTQQEFTEMLAAEKPQLVHIHNTFVMVSPSVYLACAEHGIPVVQTLHNYRLLCPAATLFRDGHRCQECMDHTLWSSVRHKCYRNSHLATATVALMLQVHRHRDTWNTKVHHYIALSQFARDKFVLGGLPAEKITVKPNFVDPDPGPDFGAGEYALYVGRLSPEKGVTTLLAAWERLGNKIPLMIVGDGAEREQLENQAASKNLANVTFLGRLERKRTLATVRKARFLVLPSLCYENFPLTLAEAFACGTPVICSRTGAMEEIVKDGETGLHFTAGDPEDLAEKAAWAWEHPQRLQEMRRAARREYEEKYTADKNYEMLTDIYRSVVPSLKASTPLRVTKNKVAIHVRRGIDLMGKGWNYLTTALQDPEQLMSLPSLVVHHVHIGEFLKLNKPWLKVADVKTVIDVGAHNGEFSSAAHSVLQNARIYAFEPLPECCDKIRKTLGKNDFLEVFQVAIGDENGSVTFWRSSFSKASSILRMSNLHQAAFPWSAENEAIEVPLKSLDDFADTLELRPKTLLKIDVQGFEDRVLRGATRILDKVDFVIVEVSVAPLYDGQAQFDSIYNMLLSSGFEYSGNLDQLNSPLDGTPLQVDALFTRPAEVTEQAA
jgi:FkbM family methyltransferase